MDVVHKKTRSAGVTGKFTIQAQGGRFFDSISIEKQTSNSI